MSVESEFEDELRLLLDEWDRLGILTDRLRLRVHEIGAVEPAKEYVRRDNEGLGEAYRRLGARGTLEGLIRRYEELFDPETLPLAQAKLDALAEPHQGEP